MLVNIRQFVHKGSAVLYHYCIQKYEINLASTCLKFEETASDLEKGVTKMPKN